MKTIVDELGRMYETAAPLPPKYEGLMTQITASIAELLKVGVEGDEGAIVAVAERLHSIAAKIAATAQADLHGLTFGAVNVNLPGYVDAGAKSILKYQFRLFQAIRSGRPQRIVTFARLLEAATLAFLVTARGERDKGTS
jgi:hypothetical protein